MTDAGWFSDPTGRFGQRYFDGSAWTSHVVGANGDVIADALPATDAYPPPVATPPVAPPVAPAVAPPPAAGPPVAGPPGGYGPAAGAYAGPGAPATAVRYGVGAGLVLGLAGLVLVALSLFALSWGPGGKSHFTDLSSQLRRIQSPRFPNIGFHLYYLYGAYLGYVLFAAVLVLTVLAGIPVPHTGIGNRVWRVIASLLAGIAAILHSMTLTYVFTNTGRTANLGSVLALIGYVVVMIGMIFGARRITRPPGRVH